MLYGSECWRIKEHVQKNNYSIENAEMDVCNTLS